MKNTPLNEESQKDIGRVRVDDLTIALPLDIKSKISRHNDRLRNKSEKNTMFYALHLGLRVMDLEAQVTETLLNNLEQRVQALSFEQAR